MKNLLYFFFIALFSCTVQKPVPRPCESLSQAIYESNDIVYCGCNPIKKLPAGNPSIEVFIFDMSKDDGEKRIFKGVVSANKEFKIDLKSLESKPYWFGYRVLGDTGNINIAQFVLKKSNQSSKSINKKGDLTNKKFSIDFSTSTYKKKNIKFDYRGAEYDTVYKNHWRISEINGYMEFEFKGKRDFLYHVLGSTQKGVSYCKIDIYVNGNKYLTKKFIPKNWHWEKIPISKFSSDVNTVKIALVGKTQLWIDKVKSN